MHTLPRQVLLEGHPHTLVGPGCILIDNSWLRTLGSLPNYLPGVWTDVGHLSQMGTGGILFLWFPVSAPHIHLA